MSNSIKTLSLVVAIFFFTSNLSGVFLPIYFKQSGLTLLEIVEVLFFTFLVIGLLPVTLMKIVRNFEAVLTIGIFTTMVFNAILIFTRNPIVLGLFYGLGIATFWPSFNLLQFRLGEAKVARTMSLLSVVVPAIAGFVGPAFGSLIITSFGFRALFSSSIVLYMIALVLSLKVKFVAEATRFHIPRQRVFWIFLGSFILWGLSESYWIAYPFFVFRVAGTILDMGIIYGLSGLLIAATTFVVSWISDVKRTRVEFAIVGSLFYASWYFAIANASTLQQLIAFSLLSGLASAFGLSWFAFYADIFPREYYASILVLMEVGYMIGRLINLAPTYVLLSNNEYTAYFILLGIVSLFMIPFFILSKTTAKDGPK